MSPLHCAIERYDTDFHTLLMMLAFDPDAASVRCTTTGDNAVDLLWKRFVHPAGYRSEAYKTKAIALKSKIEKIASGSNMMNSRVTAELALQQDKELQEFWSTMMSFIKAASFGEKKPFTAEWTNIVHDCVKIDCDPLITQFALALYPDQTREKVGGCLPIHLIWSPKPLAALLRAYPAAAAIKDPNGRLPIHLAIQRGITWEGGLEALIKAYPRGLCTPDPASGLLPSLMAGDDVNTIFNLMLANPTEPLNCIVYDAMDSSADSAEDNKMDLS